MAGIATTDDLRALAEERAIDARTLLDAGRHSGAYYVAGYAVEIGIKAVLTQDLSSYALPDKRDVAAAYTHDLSLLAKQAGLSPDADPTVQVAWSVVINWSPESRYRLHSAARAKEMVESAEELVKWLKALW